MEKNIKNHVHKHEHENDGHIHHDSFKEELFCHLPYAVLSVAISMICLSLLANTGASIKSLKHLFHDFHFLHLVFSGTGAVLIFRKYSKNVLLSFLVGFLVPAIFCTLSDSVMPFIGGQYLALDMKFHWCFISHLGTVLPFLIVGIINGFVVASHPKSKQLFYSTGSHFLHIFVSSMASMLYFATFGFSNWHHKMGFVFIFLLLAVLIPCTLADIIVPMLCARIHQKISKKEKNSFCNITDNKLSGYCGGHKDETNKS